MPGGRPLAVRPSRFGYVTGGLVLLLDAIIVAIVQLRALVHRSSDVPLAAFILGGLALYGLNDVLVAAVARVVVDDDAIEVRNQLGRRRRFARTEVGHAARRSVFAPTRSGITQDELLLIAKDGRCVTRLWEADYSSADLEHLVETLGLKWPNTEMASVRHVYRTFPGAHRFDYQVAAVVILVIVAVGLAVIAFAVVTH
jgi:hypothetical protein